MLYDIVQVEDFEETRGFIERNASRQGLSYLGLSCLESLERALPESSARIFVVDGKFPRVDGGEVLLLASEAIACIRRHYPDSRICLYSGEANIEKIAKENQVDCRSKYDFIAAPFVAELKAMLE